MRWLFTLTITFNYTNYISLLLQPLLHDAFINHLFTHLNTLEGKKFLFDAYFLSQTLLKGGRGWGVKVDGFVDILRGFRGRRERFLKKILLVLKSFHPVLPIRKVKIFEKTTFHSRSQKKSRHSCQDPPSLMQFFTLYNLICVSLTWKFYRRSYCTNNVLRFFQ